MNTIRVSLCENNENGIRSGMVHQIEFSHSSGETILRLEPVFFEDQLNGVKCFSNDRIIEMYNVTVKLICIGKCVGNIFWNLYEDYAHGGYALGFLQLLQRSKQWSFVEGWSEIYDKWSTGEDITYRDLGFETEVHATVVNKNQLNIPYK